MINLLEKLASITNQETTMNINGSEEITINWTTINNWMSFREGLCENNGHRKFLNQILPLVNESSRTNRMRCDTS